MAAGAQTEQIPEHRAVPLFHLSQRNRVMNFKHALRDRHRKDRIPVSGAAGVLAYQISSVGSSNSSPFGRCCGGITSPLGL